MNNAMTATTRSSFLVRLGLMISSMTGGASSLTVVPSSLPSTFAVVGTGVLGTSLCRQILQDPALLHIRKVTGITKTSNRHEQILSQVLGDSDNVDRARFELKTMDNLTGDEKFDSVVFCAPPSGFEDYPKAVQDAVSKLWAGPDNGGVFVFTSSGAVYPQETGTVTGSCPVSTDMDNPRTARLVLAEQACLSAGGICLRLAGLYNLQRGAHSFWLTSGKPVAGIPNGLINQLHYDDAASACLAALKVTAQNDHEDAPKSLRGRPFVVSDSHPMTRQQICASALKAAIYRGLEMPSFATVEAGPGAEPVGKVYDCSETHVMLNWKPRYESFDAFMASHA